MNGSTYSEAVTRYFESPVNVGPLTSSDGRRCRGEAGSPEDGAWIVLEASVLDGKISALAFRAYGCPHTIAACCRLTELRDGAAVETLDALDLDEMREALDVPLEKLGRMLILEDAMRSCLDDWRQGKSTETG